MGTITTHTHTCARARSTNVVLQCAKTASCWTCGGSPPPILRGSRTSLRSLFPLFPLSQKLSVAPASDLAPRPPAAGFGVAGAGAVCVGLRGPKTTSTSAAGGESNARGAPRRKSWLGRKKERIGRRRTNRVRTGGLTYTGLEINVVVHEDVGTNVLQGVPPNGMGCSVVKRAYEQFAHCMLCLSGTRAARLRQISPFAFV